jgi:Domain of unknown function (DUF4335)
MTIQRQYSLPNCKLVLEGLSDASASSTDSGRPLLSILTNAECHIAGHEKPLSGGREFFESLVMSVSDYAQAVLSGVHRPSVRDSKSPVVQLQPLGHSLHRLIFQPQESETHHPALPDPIQVDMGTVQLFDLVEAVDQFFADTQTLPDMSRRLAPLPKRYAASTEPVVKRAVPAALGVSSLVAAAALLFFLPIPERRPETAGARSTPEASPVASPGATPTPAASSPPDAASPSPSPTATDAPPDEAQVEALLASAPEITDPAELRSLTLKLRDQLDEAWGATPAFDEDLVYRVGVADNGDILGFKYVNPASIAHVNETPLLDLRYNPIESNTATQEPIAQFRVVFTPSGVIEVSPWNGRPAATDNGTTDSDATGNNAATASPQADATAAVVTDGEQLRSLNGQLYSHIQENLQTSPEVAQSLNYRVTFNQDGKIIGYEPSDQAARDNVNQTPLPQLLESDRAAGGNAQAAQAEFRVVFTENGVLQVSPWNGYP